MARARRIWETVLECGIWIGVAFTDLCLLSASKVVEDGGNALAFGVANSTKSAASKSTEEHAREVGHNESKPAARHRASVRPEWHTLLNLRSQ